MTVNKYWIYLNQLKNSGAINMFGAAPYLMDEFGVSKQEAKRILLDWMKNHNPDDCDK